MEEFIPPPKLNRPKDREGYKPPEPNDSLAGQYVMSGETESYRGDRARDRVMSIDEAKSGVLAHYQESSETKAKQAEASVNRAQELVAHFPADQYMLLIENVRGTKSDRVEYKFIKKDLIEGNDLKGSAEHTQFAYKHPRSSVLPKIILFILQIIKKY